MTNSRAWKRLLTLLLALFMITICMGATAFASDPDDPDDPVLYPVTVTATDGVDVWTGYENEKEFSEGELRSISTP
ncbi:MAG: hypothetical protein II885_14655 [Oscillospiraceae bacterium]|nr:hypothetical protein [Oscillospiraceae bacterium]